MESFIIFEWGEIANKLRFPTMFTYSAPMQRSIKFMAAHRQVRCRACGKEDCIFWTMNVPFRVVDLRETVRLANRDEATCELRFYPGEYQDLTPICLAHPLYPAETSKPPPPDTRTASQTPTPPPTPPPDTPSRTTRAKTPTRSGSPKSRRRV